MSERRVYLAQLKCPAGHCVLAAAGEYDTPEAADALRASVIAQFAKLVGAGALNPKCGLCDSRVLTASVDQTPFRTIAEATPHLAQAQDEQMRVAQFAREHRN